MAKFQNKVSTIEDSFFGSVGLNNRKAYPQTERRKNFSVDFSGELEQTPTERIKTLCKPVKLLMTEQRRGTLTRNPENPTGHVMLREQYSLPKPNSFKYGRA